MELTRETVELIALSFLDDGLSFEQREAMCRLVDSDAALRADRDKLRQANEAMTKERDVLKVQLAECDEEIVRLTKIIYERK